MVDGKAGEGEENGTALVRASRIRASVIRHHPSVRMLYNSRSVEVRWICEGGLNPEGIVRERWEKGEGQGRRTTYSLRP